MEYWVRPLLILLIALKALPFLISQLLFASIRFDSDPSRRRKVLIPGTLMNLAWNLAAAWGVSYALFHMSNPWVKMAQLLHGTGSYQDLTRLGVSLLICAALAVLGGVLLRMIFFRQIGCGRGGRAAAAILALVCAGAAFLGAAASWNSTSQLYISEVCRETSASYLTNEERGARWGGDEKVCYVAVTNPGQLTCGLSELWLSDSSEDLKDFSFAPVTLPPGGTVRLVMDAEHGLDLDRRGKSYVFLSDPAGRILDTVQVPGLEEDDRWTRAEDGTWSIQGTAYGNSVQADVPMPELSAASGFYTGDFDLTISAQDGMMILYTLDGSDPTVSGSMYTGPIHIADRSSEDNVWSARTDVSAEFVFGSGRFAVPQEPVDKCTVVRAACLDEEGNFSQVLTSCYLVGFDSKEGYDGLGIAVITADPDDLFGEKKGIYVLGDTFRRKYDPETANNSWWFWPANYHSRGRNWERKASVQFFDAERNLLLSKEIGIRIKGQASAGLLPKGINLYARKSYDGVPVFSADLFGTGYQAKRISLSAGGNNVDLKVRDWLTAKLTDGLGLSMSHNQPYALFLEGEYWGNYWLQEQMDEYYFADLYGLNAVNVVVIKNGALKSGVQQDADGYAELVEWMKDTDLSLPENESKLSGMIDLDNFFTYYAAEVFVANEDRTLKNNMLLWRTRIEENEAEGDGRWRWALFDTNYYSCYASSDSDTIAYTMEKDAIFKSLMNSPLFRDGFYAALRKMAEEVFTAERGGKALDEYYALMEVPMTKEHSRFSPSRTSLLKTQTKKIREFFDQRKEYILSLCDAYDASRP